MRKAPKLYTNSRSKAKNVAFKSTITKGPWGPSVTREGGGRSTGGGSVPSTNTIKIDGLSSSQQDEIRRIIKGMKGS